MTAASGEPEREVTRTSYRIATEQSDAKREALRERAKRNIDRSKVGIVEAARVNHDLGAPHRSVPRAATGDDGNPIILDPSVDEFAPAAKLINSFNQDIAGGIIPARADQVFAAMLSPAEARREAALRSSLMKERGVLTAAIEALATKEQALRSEQIVRLGETRQEPYAPPDTRGVRRAVAVRGRRLANLLHGALALADACLITMILWVSTTPIRLSDLRGSIATYPVQAIAAAAAACAYVIATAKVIAWTFELAGRPRTSPPWIGMMRVGLSSLVSGVALLAVLALTKTREVAWAEVSPLLAPALGALSCVSLLLSGRAGADARRARTEIDGIDTEIYIQPQAAWEQGMQRLREQLQAVALHRADLEASIRNIDEQVEIIDLRDDLAFRAVRDRARSENAILAASTNYLEREMQETVGIYDELTREPDTSSTGGAGAAGAVAIGVAALLLLSGAGCTPPEANPEPSATVLVYQLGEEAEASATVTEILDKYRPGDRLTLVPHSGAAWGATVPVFEFNADNQFRDFVDGVAAQVLDGTVHQTTTTPHLANTRLSLSSRSATAAGLSAGFQTPGIPPDWAVVVDTSTSMPEERELGRELGSIHDAWIGSALLAGARGRLRIYEAAPAAVLAPLAERSVAGSIEDLRALTNERTGDELTDHEFTPGGSSDVGVTLERLGQSGAPPSRIIVLTDGRLIDTGGAFDFTTGLPHPDEWKRHLDHIRSARRSAGGTITWCGVDRRGSRAGLVDASYAAELHRHLSEYSEALGATQVEVFDACEFRRDR